MRFVIMLGALALLALSTTAEDQDKAIDLAGKDILIREVRDATAGKKKRKSKPKGRRRVSRNKNNNKKGRGKTGGSGGSGRRKKGGRRKGNTKRKEGKGKKRKGTRRTRKGGKSAFHDLISRQVTTYDCATFYNKDNTAAVRDFRYARNQIQKARRAKKRVEKLEKLTEKAATAFLNGSAFFKSCSDPRAAALYDGLSQCNVTAANACNPASLKNRTDYDDIDVCITALETTMNSSESCLSKPKCGDDGTCAYEPIGMVPDRACDYISFDKDVAKRLNKNCTDANVVGSFTYCNNLLKDHFDVASNCFSSSPTMTTVAPSSGRLRKALNIWNI